MNKELQKLLKQINDKKNEVKSLVNDGKLDKAKAAKEELKELQNRFDLLYDLDEEEQDGIENKVNNGTAKQVGGDVKPDKKNIVKSFVNIVKAGFAGNSKDGIIRCQQKPGCHRQTVVIKIFHKGLAGDRFKVAHKMCLAESGFGSNFGNRNFVHIVTFNIFNNQLHFVK